jgi:hypothetical protein
MKKLTKEEEKKLLAVKRKIKKGYGLVQLYWCGIPKWRFIKGEIESKYPFITEDFVVDVLKPSGIEIIDRR